MAPEEKDMAPEQNDREGSEEHPPAPPPAAKAIPDVPEAQREVPLPGTEDAPTRARRDT